MKREREFIEVSDDEWSLHSDSFQPSRVLNRQSSPPPIESFAYSKNNTSNNSHNDNPDGIDDSICILDSSSSEEGNQNVADEPENLEDEDAYLEVSNPSTSSLNRGRRFVIEDDEDEDEVGGSEVGLDDFGDISDFSGFEEEEENLEDDGDVIKKALRKCGKISAELKEELYGTSAAQFDHYSEVEEASAVKIVTQDDVNEACGADHSDPMLKPYQLVGVNFLLLLYRKKIAGAILADEMGLGKTVQAITHLALLKHLENDPGPHLIVCPASVLENWERELNKWIPSFTILQYHGASRSAYSKELSSLSKAGLPPPFNVILVCYSLFERHSAQQKDDRKILKRWRWSCVIMDEAHALKDKNSYRWKNLMTVARNANQRLMLTGTPLQNDLHELWSMLEFMMPDLFETGDVDLRKLLNAEDMDLIARMKSILGPFILRRLKSNVMQQLVPKMQMIEYVHMERAQEDAYKEALENYRSASQSRMSKHSGINSNSVAAVLPRRQISNYFLQLRKIANHPLLVRRIFKDGDVVRFAKMLHPKGVFGFECTLERVIEELKSYNDFSIHRLLLYYGDTGMKGMLSDEHVMISAKCRALADLLPELEISGHRVLIFSQWTSMLDILEWTLDVIGVTYRRLDGSTQVTERQTIVDTFNKDASIFACLLSTRAGGQGLNLTGADTVIIHDMDFNPQIDRQAEDRCHRIGQTKPVTVYRLVTKGTVDENVYEIAKRKLTLDAAVLESGKEVDDEGQMSDKTRQSMATSIPHRLLFIDGDWREPIKKNRIPIINPASEEIIGDIPAATAEDVDVAVEAARKALFRNGGKDWASASGAHRAKYLRAIAAKITERKSELAKLEAIDCGKPLDEADWDIDDVAGCFEYHAELAEALDSKQKTPVSLPLENFKCHVLKEPIGVVGLITPWNYPLLMATWKVAPALAAGCTAILKPSELASVTCLELGEVCKEVGLPPGVLNILTGVGPEAGAPLASHPHVDKIAFTGSSATGSKIMTAAAQLVKPVTLELGGKSPIVVFEDVDLDKAAEWSLFGCFWTNGQICSATSRLLVHESIAAEFLDKLVKWCKNIKISDPLEEGCRLGPVVNSGQYEKVKKFISTAKDEGATILCGGVRPQHLKKGYFIEPAVITDVNTSMQIWREEVFGPVLCVKTFKTEEEAIELANDTHYGLAAAVLSQDLERCGRMTKAFQAGIVWVNCSQPCFSQAPWGGKKRSGFGRELGEWGLNNYLNIKQVTEYVSNDPWAWYASPSKL